MDIKAVHTISDTSVNSFNRDLTTIINDLQSDGLVVEVQYQTVEGYGGTTKYTAVIMGRGK